METRLLYLFVVRFGLPRSSVSPMVFGPSCLHSSPMDCASIGLVICRCGLVGGREVRRRTPRVTGLIGLQFSILSRHKQVVSFKEFHISYHGLSRPPVCVIYVVSSTVYKYTRSIAPTFPVLKLTSVQLRLYGYSVG